MGLLEFYGKSVQANRVMPQNSLLVRFHDMLFVGVYLAMDWKKRDFADGEGVVGWQSRESVTIALSDKGKGTIRGWQER